MSTHTRIATNALSAAFILVALGACQTRKFNNSDVKDETFHSSSFENPRDPKWIYNGTLPHLQSPTLVASLKSHTLRVTGFLPSSYDVSQLPYYAVLDVIGGRNRITVVYPIATGNLNDVSESSGAPVNNSPGSYSKIISFPFNRFGEGEHKTTPWGGFPYLAYSGTSVAFHGPITPSTTGTEWHLWRGPVSHGCNRMQGEHVVELAHLIGEDMSHPHQPTDQNNFSVNLKVTSDFDRMGDGKFANKLVDVDYPTQKFDPKVPSADRNTSFFKSVALPPSGESHVYKTWNAMQFPRFVCEYNSGRPLDSKHCDYKGAFRSAQADPGSQGGGSGGGSISLPPEMTKGLGKSNAKMCRDGVNLRKSVKTDNGTLEVGEVIGTAEQNLRVFIFGVDIVSTQFNRTFTKIGFEKDHAPNVGFVAKDFVCADGSDGVLPQENNGEGNGLPADGPSMDLSHVTR